MLRNEKTIIKNLFEIKLFEHIGTFGFWHMGVIIIMNLLHDK